MKKAEENKSHPPNDRGRGEELTDRGRDNRGSGPVDVDRKGQCKIQLMGRQCDRNCQYSHKSMCRLYREKGWLGCHDKRCNLLHPYDCRSVIERWICARKECQAWHDRWEAKAPGTPINAFGAWNGGFFQTPPKGFERAPGIKEKVERRNEKGEKAGGNEGEENSKGGSERAPSLKDRVNQNAEALEKVSQSLEHLTSMQQSQWNGQWGNNPNQWGGGYNW